MCTVNGRTAAGGICDFYECTLAQQNEKYKETARRCKCTAAQIYFIGFYG